MSVVAAVERELAEVRERDPRLADGTLAAIMLACAAEIDDPSNSATSKSMNAHQLRDTTVKLRELTPPARMKDEVDVLRKERADRRAAATDRPQAAP